MDIRVDSAEVEGREAMQVVDFNGGPDRTRICDLLRVKQAL